MVAKSEKTQGNTSNLIGSERIKIVITFNMNKKFLILQFVGNIKNIEP